MFHGAVVPYAAVQLHQDDKPTVQQALVPHLHKVTLFSLRAHQWQRCAISVENDIGGDRGQRSGNARPFAWRCVPVSCG